MTTCLLLLPSLLGTWGLAQSPLSQPDLLVELAATDPTQSDLPAGLSRTDGEGSRVAVGAGVYMVAYTQQIPGTDVRFEMVPIPGGELRLPVDSNHPDAEVRVKIEPFWIGKYEVTWNEYIEFMQLNHRFRAFQRKERHQGQQEKVKLPSAGQVDAVTAPTEIYDPPYRFEFANGPRQPAFSMTQFAARQYTKWLSGLVTGIYRLPSEAEWTYAALAGARWQAQSADEIRLVAVCWQDDEDPQPSNVGKLPPNAWGLYDMQGNMAEWVLDSGGQSFWTRLSTGDFSMEQTIGWSPSSRFGHLACGGGWLDDPDACGILSRTVESDDLWDEDPCLPVSPWWMADADGQDRKIGFRLLRPYNEPEPQDMLRFWEADSRELAQAVAGSVSEGRAVRERIHHELQFSPWRDPRESRRPWEYDY